MLVLGDGTNVGFLGRLTTASRLALAVLLLVAVLCVLLQVIEAITMFLAKVATTLYLSMM
jgi:hypothetical protein